MRLFAIDSKQGTIGGPFGERRLELEAPPEVDVLLKLLRQGQLLDAALHEKGEADEAGGVGQPAAAPVPLGVAVAVAVAGVVGRVAAGRRRVLAHLAVAALLPAAPPCGVGHYFIWLPLYIASANALVSQLIDRRLSFSSQLRTFVNIW